MTEEKKYKLNRKLKLINSEMKKIHLLAIVSFCMAINQNMPMKLRMLGLVLIIMSLFILVVQSVRKDLIVKQVQELEAFEEKRARGYEAYHNGYTGEEQDDGVQDYKMWSEE